MGGRVLTKRPSELGTPDAWILARMEWDIFGTLTWAEVPPKSVQEKCVAELIRRVAKQVYKKSSLDILWAVRYEEGESTGRAHYHILIGAYKDAPHTNKHTFAAQIKHIWENDVRENRYKNYRDCVGHADIRPYDSSKSGAEYICKPALSARDFYELQKFNDGFKAVEYCDATAVSLGPRLVLEIAKARSKSHKIRGFARFLREWKQRNVGSKRVRSDVKKYQILPSQVTFKHPADDETCRTYV
jgi:hypothetical protein